MKNSRTLLLITGLVGVFVGTTKVLEAMGVESAVWACLMAAIVATFMTAAIM